MASTVEPVVTTAVRFDREQFCEHTLCRSVSHPRQPYSTNVCTVMYITRCLTSFVRHSSSMPSAAALLQLMKSRRSIHPKDFTGRNREISQQQLELMLEAARWAPTHKRTEPWHFVVLSSNSKTYFEELTLKCCEEILPAEEAERELSKLKRKQSRDWPKVHCYIAICMKRHSEKVPEWEEIAAVACGVQNLSLVAHSLGVSGYWSSWQAAARDSAAMHQFLGLDSSRGDKCLGVWAVGQVDEQVLSTYKAKRKELSDKVTWKTWLSVSAIGSMCVWVKQLVRLTVSASTLNTQCRHSVALRRSVASWCCAPHSEDLTSRCIQICQDQNPFTRQLMRRVETAIHCMACSIIMLVAFRQETFWRRSYFTAAKPLD